MWRGPESGLSRRPRWLSAGLVPSLRTGGIIRLVKHANLGCNHVSSCCIIHCTNDLMRFFTKHTAFTANNVQTRPELAGDLIENAGEAYEK